MEPAILAIHDFAPTVVGPTEPDRAATASAAIRVRELRFRDSARYVQFCCALAGFATTRWSRGMLQVCVT